MTKRSWPSKILHVALGLVLYLPSQVSAQDVAHTAPKPGDWPSYNRTLTSERFAPQAQITPQNVSKLRKVCEYDTGVTTSFQTGPVVVDGTMIFTSEKDTFAVDAATCKERWHTALKYKAASSLEVNRGVAVLDGRVFRGLQDGRIIALDAQTGKLLWQRQIGIPKKGESVPAALVAYDGLVYGGNAGGDNYGVKGRMYALEAATGKVVWEFYLVPKEGKAKTSTATSKKAGRGKSWGNKVGVPITGGATWTSYTLDPQKGLLYVPGGNPAPDFKPDLRPGANLFSSSVVVLDMKTGAYRHHYKLLREDFHDWDVSAAPTLIQTRKGRNLMAVAIKDGNLYSYDRGTNERLYKVPITTIKNAEAKLTSEGTYFCPGTQGGAEWNGPAYSPQTNLLYTGAVDWCANVRVEDDAKTKSASAGQPWTGSADEKNIFGNLDPAGQWAGWVYAYDADTGKLAWIRRTPSPILAGVTPTAGGVLFTADMGGTFYAFNAADGKPLWQAPLGASAGGGVISYTAGGRQLVAVAVGMSSPVWPVKKAPAKMVVYGLPR